MNSFFIRNKWFKNRFFNGPTKFKSSKNRWRLKPDKFCPLAEIHGASINGNAAVVSFVVALFKRICPFNISRKVPLIVINTFNGFFAKWLWANMLVKSRKRFTPFIANGNPTASIILKGWVGRVTTTPNHVLPRLVFGRVAHAMNKAPFNAAFIIKAATAFCMSRYKICGHGYSGVATTTLAFPLGSALITVFGTFNDCKATKGLTSKINKWWHKNLQAKGCKQIVEAAGRLLESLLFGCATLSANLKNITKPNKCQQEIAWRL